MRPPPISTLSPGGSPAAEDDPLPRGASVGRYAILERLGAGGMRVVYAAYDPELDRKVAIKLVRPDRYGASDSDGRAHLLREGRALARLAHPNVVAIHDVGTFGDQVFIAMEHVAGRTLRAWRDERPRSWREVRDVYLAAGRALAAAHALGIVHRDFKPENALIGADGRVRVLDFGLARAAGPAEAAPPAPDGDPAPRVTTTGALVGTPLYMAPEQWQRADIDARADQFSFAVAVYEALYGALPFAQPGTGGEPPRSARVPSRLGRALARALRRDPAQRFPTMDALLAELAHDPAAIRRRWLAIAAAAAVVAAAGLSVRELRARKSLVCQGAERQLESVWDDGARSRVRAAFVATGRGYAGDAYRGVARALDDYAAEWVRMHTEVCEATRLRGEQSERLLDLRMACLAQRRVGVRALVEVLEGADAKAVERAVQAAQGLAPVADCANLALLDQAEPPPTDPALRRLIDEIERRLAEARALQAAGRFAPALAVAAPAAAEASAVAYRPILAASLYLVGTLENDAGDARAAEQSLRTALLAAEAGRRAELAADAATWLVRIVGYDQGRRDDGHEWGRRALALVAAAGNQPRALAQLLNNLGVLLFAEERFADALDHHLRALALRAAAFGPVSQPVAASLSNIGLVYLKQGALDKSVEYQRRAVAIVEQALGATHPALAGLLDNLAAALFLQASYDETLAISERSLAIKEASYGATHPLVAVSLNTIGTAYYEQHRLADALAMFQRALAIKEQVYGPEHRAVALSLDNVASTLLDLGRLDEARALHERALAIKEKVLGPEHSEVAMSLDGLGRILQRQRRYREALHDYARALAIREKALGPRHALTGVSLARLGEVYAAEGQRAKALDLLERALAIQLAAQSDPADVAATRAALQAARR